MAATCSNVKSKKNLKYKNINLHPQHRPLPVLLFSSSLVFLSADSGGKQPTRGELHQRAAQRACFGSDVGAAMERVSQ